MSQWALTARLISIVVGVLLSSCGQLPKIPAKGHFLGKTIASTVDSEVARFYIEDYFQGHGLNGSLRQKVDEIHIKHKNSIPSRDELSHISKAFSVDFAALFFANRLLAQPCNRALDRAFEKFLSEAMLPSTSASTSRLDSQSYLILFVPGWDYAENGHLTGADFAEPRKLATAIGIENHLVELPPTGSVSENAAFLTKAIVKHAHRGKKIVLAGASSAGPAIHLSLAEQVGNQALSAVKAWINLGGILQGSPLIDYLQNSPQSWLFDAIVWWKGWNKDSILSMGTQPSQLRFQRLKIHADVFIVNYLGIALSGQLSPYSRDKYPLLTASGPNDGLTLLTDVIAPHSLTIVALGSDHFFAEDPKIAEKTLALMRLVIFYLENDTLVSGAVRCDSAPQATAAAIPMKQLSE